MAKYFLDSSAIVKRYLPELGHNWIENLCNTENHALYISQIALVEVVAAICRRERERSITIAERNSVISLFQKDIRQSYNIWPITTELYTFAGDLCRSHPLRAYDAVQLACTLTLCNYSLIEGAAIPIFVSGDIRLLDIAIAEGLSIENPNNYQ